MLYGESKLQKMNLCRSCKEETGNQWVLWIEREDIKRLVDSKSASCQLQGICNSGIRNRAWMVGAKRSCAFSVLGWYKGKLYRKAWPNGLVILTADLSLKFSSVVSPLTSFPGFLNIFKAEVFWLVCIWWSSWRVVQDMFRCVVK